MDLRGNRVGLCELGYCGSGSGTWIFIKRIELSVSIKGGEFFTAVNYK
jgi:hypothetical protein